MMRKTVCVDLDGVLAEYDGWKGVDHFGEPLPYAVQMTMELAEFADVVIFTTRCNPELNREATHLLVNRVREWLDKHGFVYHDIYCGVGKPVASAYIDDRAVVFRPAIKPTADPDGEQFFAGYCAGVVEEARRLCGVAQSLLLAERRKKGGV